MRVKFDQTPPSPQRGQRRLTARETRQRRCRHVVGPPAPRAATSVREPHRAASLPRTKKEEQRQRTEKDEAAQHVNNRESENARLGADLTVKVHQYLLMCKRRVQ